MNGFALGYLLFSITFIQIRLDYIENKKNKYEEIYKHKDYTQI